MLTAKRQRGRQAADDKEGGDKTVKMSHSSCSPRVKVGGPEGAQKAATLPSRLHRELGCTGSNIDPKGKPDVRSFLFVFTF